MKKHEIAILIPCYNEAQTIKKVVKDYAEALPEATIYVYDNNSTDGTDKMAEQAGAVVRHEKKQGKGNVVNTMFREVNAECYLMVDGDDTYPADKARALCDLILSGEAEMAIGDRLSSTYFTENKRAFHNFGNTLVRFLVNILYARKGEKVTDIMTGMRAMSNDFVKNVGELSPDFRIETEMTIYALRHSMKIVSVPIAYRDRPAGSKSKLNTVKDGIKVIGAVFAQGFRRD